MLSSANVCLSLDLLCCLGVFRLADLTLDPAADTLLALANTLDPPTMELVAEEEEAPSPAPPPEAALPCFCRRDVDLEGLGEVASSS